MERQANNYPPIVGPLYPSIHADYRARLGELQQLVRRYSELFELYFVSQHVQEPNAFLLVVDILLVFNLYPGNTGR